MSEDEQMGSPLINSRYMLKLEKKILTLTKFFFPSKRVRQNKVLFGSDSHFFRTFKNGPKFNPDKLHHNEGVKVFWKITKVTQLKWKHVFSPPSCKTPDKLYRNARLLLIDWHIHISANTKIQIQGFSRCLKFCDGHRAPRQLRGTSWLDTASGAWYWWCAFRFVRNEMNELSGSVHLIVSQANTVHYAGHVVI